MKVRGRGCLLCLPLKMMTSAFYSLDQKPLRLWNKKNAKPSHMGPIVYVVFFSFFFSLIELLCLSTQLGNMILYTFKRKCLTNAWLFILPILLNACFVILMLILAF